VKLLIGFTFCIFAGVIQRRLFRRKMRTRSQREYRICGSANIHQGLMPVDEAQRFFKKAIAQP
jgi:hypothetical protein